MKDAVYVNSPHCSQEPIEIFENKVLVNEGKSYVVYREIFSDGARST